MSKGKTEVPQPFPITDALRDWARINVPRLDLDYHTQELVDWCLANGKRYSDWSAMWRNWMRRSMDFKPRFKAPAPSYQAANLPISPGVIDIAIQRMARAHGIDPAGKTESQIANEIWAKEQAGKSAR
jgi:hypothetical protein